MSREEAFPSGLSLAHAMGLGKLRMDDNLKMKDVFGGNPFGHLVEPSFAPIWELKERLKDLRRERDERRNAAMSANDRVEEIEPVVAAFEEAIRSLGGDPQ